MKALMAFVSFWIFLSLFGGSDWLKGTKLSQPTTDIVLQTAVQKCIHVAAQYLFTICVFAFSSSHSISLQSMM